MNSLENVLLKLYFPQFTNPPISRFQSLFFILNKKKTKNVESNIICPELVIQGLDKRTTLIIKNIPNTIKKYKFRNIIEKYGNINHLCLIPDSNFANLLTAYLNVVNYKTVASIYMGLRKYSFNYKDKVYFIKIFYSNIQGKEQLKKIFKVDYRSIKSSVNK